MSNLTQEEGQRALNWIEQERAKYSSDIFMLAKRLDTLEATVKRLDGKSWGQDD